MLKTSFLLCLCLAAAYPVSAQNAAARLSDFAAMAGCWERVDKAKDLVVSEYWMKPAGTSILGIGRTVKGSQTVDHEFMRIELRPGGMFFIARPSANKEETEFKLVSSTRSEFVFENQAHDFPQRVIYLVNGRKLTGRIEGIISGKPVGIDFPMKRVRCE